METGSFLFLSIKVEKYWEYKNTEKKKVFLLVDLGIPLLQRVLERNEELSQLHMSPQGLQDKPSVAKSYVKESGFDRETTLKFRLVFCL